MSTDTFDVLDAVDDYLKETGHYNTGEVQRYWSRHTLTLSSVLPRWYLEDIARSVKEVMADAEEPVHIRIRRTPR